MLPEIFTETWHWLLDLSKVQLILLGGAVALLVALSKVLRLLFLVMVLLFFLVMVLPQLLTREAESPLPELAPGERVFPQD